MPAPIIIFCYNRPLHLQKTIEALQKNTLAMSSPLIVFSDAAKTNDAIALVTEVRTYLAQVKGFLSISVKEADLNKGLAKSVIQGVTEILKIYDKAIVLEDDMISTPDFLDFMNSALDFYQDRQDIFSITGYSPPFELPNHYQHSLYLAPRTSSWGWATWRHQWNKADWEIPNFNHIKKDKLIKKKLIAGGEDLWPMLVKQQQGVINSWSVRWTLTQAIHDGYSIYPVYPKIQNIGTDGSGTNFTFSTDQYTSKLSDRRIEMVNDLSADPTVIQLFKKSYSLPFVLKLKNWIKYQIFPF